jgi:hypothetical protein
MPQPVTAPRLRAGVVSRSYIVVGQDCLTSYIIYNIKYQLDFVHFVMPAQAPASQNGQSQRHFSMS